MFKNVLSIFFEFFFWPNELRSCINLSLRPLILKRYITHCRHQIFNVYFCFLIFYCNIYLPIDNLFSHMLIWIFLFFLFFENKKKRKILTKFFQIRTPQLFFLSPNVLLTQKTLHLRYSSFSFGTRIHHHTHYTTQKTTQLSSFSDTHTRTQTHTNSLSIFTKH